MNLWLGEPNFTIKISAFMILFSFAGAGNVNERL